MSLYSVLLRSVCGLLIVVSMSSTATGAEATEFDDIPKHFFELVAKGDFGAAVDYAGGTSPTMDPDAVDSLRRQLTKAISVYGSYSFHERLLEEKVGTRFVRLYYIIGYEKAVVGVKLTLYRPKDKWTVHALNTVDNSEINRGNYPPK